MTPTLDPQLSTRYAADGFVHLQDCIPAETVSSLVEAVEAAPERPGAGGIVEANPLTLDTMDSASNLFYASEALQAFLSSPVVVDLVTPILGPDVWVRWDQAVWKGPGAPEFPWHQDNGYTGLDAEHLQLWIALTDMTPANGGLAVVPGGHRSLLEHRWVGHHVEAAPVGDPVAIEASAGDVVLFSSLLPHSTTPNTTRSTRLAYVAEFLPTSVGDPSVPAPHLVIASGGRAVRSWQPRGVGAN